MRFIRFLLREERVKKILDSVVVCVSKREAVDFSKPRKDIVIQDLSNSPYRTIYQDVYIR